MANQKRLTRADVAKKLGISYDRVRLLEGRMLAVQYDDKGKPFFLIEDVNKIKNDPRLHPPNKRAAFKCLDGGARVIDLVVKFGVSVEKALAYQESYARAVGGLVIPGSDLQELKAMGFFGDGDVTSRQIVGALKSAINVLRKHRTKKMAVKKSNNAGAEHEGPRRARAHRAGPSMKALDGRELIEQGRA